MVNRSGNLLATNDSIINDLLKDENYYISLDGRVFTRIAETGKIFADKNAWRETGFFDEEDGYTSIKYHGFHLRRCRIIYAKFVGPLAIDLVVNHKNAHRSDDSPGNLELITQSANNIHRYQITGKPAVIGNCVLTWSLVEQIRKEKIEGATHKVLCLKYGLSKGHISEIVNHKIWIKGKPYTGKQKTFNLKEI